jgi:hypothetical protein
METLIIHPENKEQLVAVKAFLKALKISFEKTQKLDESYSKEFSDKILQGRKDIENGQGVKLAIEDLWK